MNERILLRTCFLLFLIGISLLFAAHVFSSVEEVSLSQISPEDIGKTIQVTGKAQSVTHKEGHLFFTLVGEEHSLKIVQFNSHTNIDENSFVAVTGIVQQYKGVLEIIARRIEEKP